MIEVEATIKINFVIQDMTKAQFDFRTLETQKSLILDGIKSTKDFDWVGVIKAKDIPYEICDECRTKLMEYDDYYYLPFLEDERGSQKIFCSTECLKNYVVCNCCVKTVGR